MSTASPSLRNRNSKKRPTTPSADDAVSSGAGVVERSTVSSEWDYKLALAVVTALAFMTRFYGISHPDQVVFDEVHFGKVMGDILIQHRCVRPY